MTTLLIAQNETRESGEEWRDVVGSEGILQVSDLGRVKRLARAGSTGCNGNIDKSWTPPPPKCRIWVSGKGSIHISILVLEAFVGKCPEGMECCHYDDDLSNNKLSNLRWDTHSNNVKDGYRNGAPRKRRNGGPRRKWREQ